ncbi:MAG TPA: hypothetical protein VGD62_09925, partial [Acidobacteriaceae bacterium]
LLAFAAVVAAGLRWHEGWADEGQAWNIAREMRWWPMVAHLLRYEGTPGLWHTLLWLLVRLHVTYTGMHYVAGLLAVAGIAVFLRFAPFPRYLKLLLPFTFFLAYQDAVVARSYVFFTGLGFASAATLCARRPRPVLLALLLGLVANISFHGCILSGGLAAVALFRFRRIDLLPPRTARIASALLLCFWAAAIATILPTPHDLNFAEANAFHKTRVWAPGPPGNPQGGRWIYANDQIPVDPNPDLPHLVTPEDATHSLTMQPGELAPIPFVRPHFPLPHRLWLKTAHILGLITFPLSTYPFLGLSAVALLCAFALSRPPSPQTGHLGWVPLLPYLFMLLAFSRFYLAPRHAGTLFTAFLISLWLAWPRSSQTNAPPPSRASWVQVALTTVLILIAVQQIGWTEDAVTSDQQQPYSGDWATAHFLKTAIHQGPVASFYYHANGALAYTPGYHYINHPHSYWLWSTTQRINQQAPTVLAQHPLYVIVGGFSWGNQGDVEVDWADPFAGFPFMPMADSYRIMSFFKQNGYIEKDRFCGRLFMRDGYSEEVCNTVLQRTNPAPTPDLATSHPQGRPPR